MKRKGIIDFSDVGKTLVYVFSLHYSYFARRIMDKFDQLGMTSWPCVVPIPRAC